MKRAGTLLVALPIIVQEAVEIVEVVEAGS